MLPHRELLARQFFFAIFLSEYLGIDLQLKDAQPISKIFKDSPILGILEINVGPAIYSDALSTKIKYDPTGEEKMFPRCAST